MLFNRIDHDRRQIMSLSEKIFMINWGLVAIVTALAAIGYIGLYSAAGGDASAYASQHLFRFLIGLLGMLIVALIDIRFWRVISYAVYTIALLLLIIVAIKGRVGMGAQRWINFGFINIQPSEMMKIGLVMALAHYYDRREPGSGMVTNVSALIFPLTIIAIPVALVLTQPDLGTAIIIAAIGVVLLFVAGVRWWFFASGIAAISAAIPLAWQYLFKEYQKERILTFLDPGRDPLGAGYHVTQSKIALGSGGLSGKGFLQGTQSHLNFLPEKQTDFIFTLLAEEWGLIGGLFILTLYMITFGYGLLIALNCRNRFARLLCIGIVMNVMFYVAINVGMVMGLLPVVGVPLPLISYGGTAMLSVLFGFGLLLSASIHRDVKMRSYF